MVPHRSPTRRTLGRTWSPTDTGWGTWGTDMEPGRWARAAEAAMVLNVSEKTIRRKAQRGALPARRVSTSHGEAWQVWLSDGDTAADTGGPSADSLGDQDGHGGPSASTASNGQTPG